MIYFSFPVLAETTRITFISPDPIDTKNVFWSDFISIMRKSASDLELELEVLYGDKNRFSTKRMVTEVLNRETPPHFLVTIANLRLANYILEMAEKKQVYTLIVNTNLDRQDKRNVGEPRERFAYWLGSVYPNDQQAGYLLGEELLKIAQSKSKISTFPLLSFAGTRDTSVSTNRIKGLKKFVDDYSDKVILQQTMYGGWDKSIVKKMMPKLLRRYPSTNIYWSAGGGMSLGILDSLESSKTISVVGEIEWSNSILEKILQDKIDVAVGGHFMDGAWTMVLIKDFSKGIDFKDDIGLNYETNFYVVTKKKLLEKKNYFFNNEWKKINFRQYSKHYNPHIKKYDFNLNY